MKATLIVNDKKIEIEISEKEVEALTKMKRTGYERVELGEKFFYVVSDGKVGKNIEKQVFIDDDYFEVGNYYSDRTVAKNNARADKLMRQLRRFAVEHRKNKIMWGGGNTNWSIYFSHLKKELDAVWNINDQIMSTYFDSKETCEAAIEAFRDELMWYFTEYKDSL